MLIGSHLTPPPASIVGSTGTSTDPFHVPENIFKANRTGKGHLFPERCERQSHRSPEVPAEMREIFPDQRPPKRSRSCASICTPMTQGFRWRRQRPRAPILSTLGLPDYGVAKNVFNQVVILEKSRRASSDATFLISVCCTSEAASQHAVALQQRFILVIKRQRC